VRRVYRNDDGARLDGLAHGRRVDPGKGKG